MPAVLVVEGIRLLHDRTRDWFDLSVWIDLDPDTAGERAKARNVLQGDDLGDRRSGVAWLRDAIDAMPTMAPDRRPTISRAYAWATKKFPMRLTPRIRSKSSRYSTGSRARRLLEISRRARSPPSSTRPLSGSKR